MDFITLLDWYVTTINIIFYAVNECVCILRSKTFTYKKCLTQFISHTIPTSLSRKISRHKKPFPTSTCGQIVFFPSFLHVSITLKIKHKMNRLFRCTLDFYSPPSLLVLYFGGISISTRLYQNNKFFVIFFLFLTFSL